MFVRGITIIIHTNLRFPVMCYFYSLPSYTANVLNPGEGGPTPQRVFRAIDGS